MPPYLVLLLHILSLDIGAPRLRSHDLITLHNKVKQLQTRKPEYNEPNYGSVDGAISKKSQQVLPYTSGVCGFASLDSRQVWPARPDPQERPTAGPRHSNLPKEQILGPITPYLGQSR